MSVPHDMFPWQVYHCRMVQGPVSLEWSVGEMKFREKNLQVAEVHVRVELPYSRRTMLCCTWSMTM